MISSKERMDSESKVDKSPQSALERDLIRAYLREKGYRLEDLHKLPKEEARKLMKEACLYASLKLAEVEARAGFQQKIHYE